MRATSLLRQAAAASHAGVDRASTVGFIGVGLMGKEMFRNLITTTRSLPTSSGTLSSLQSLPSLGTTRPSSYVVCDVSEDNVRSFLEGMRKLGVESGEGEGMIRVAKNPEEVALLSSTIVSMIPTSKHVQSVYVGGGGANNSILSALKSNKLSEEEVKSTLCMDESTIEMAASKAVSEEIERAGARCMDAPVSGGVIGAKNATLTIMVGSSSQEPFDRAKPLLQTMGKKVLRCGGLGAGLAAKISNNLMLGISMLGLSEAMLLGQRLGLDPQLLGDIINTSTGQSWSSSVNFPVPSVTIGSTDPPAHREYAGGFVTKLAHKDLALAVAAADEVGEPLKLGRLTEAIYRKIAAPEHEYSNKDFSVIYKWLSEGGAAELGDKL